MTVKDFTFFEPCDFHEKDSYEQNSLTIQETCGLKVKNKYNIICL